MHTSFSARVVFLKAFRLPARSVLHKHSQSTIMNLSRMFYSTQKGDMMKYQQSLPSLPVPPLKQTLERYLVSVRPLLSDREYEQTKKCVEDFGRPGQVGEMLHEKLVKRSLSMDNWLSDWWLEVAYLAYRLPVPIHVSPATIAPLMDVPDQDALIDQATRALVATAYFKKCIDTESLPPDMAGKKPLSMDQYHLLYACCRIPCEKVDTLRRTPPNLALHGIVGHNGHFFKVQLMYLDHNGTPQIAPFDHVRQQVVELMQSSPEPAQYQIGLLTSEHRDVWCQKRQRLLKDPVNRRSLDTIEQAILFLGIDAPRPDINAVMLETPYSNAYGTVLAHRCLHGGGVEFNTGNRWFDTSVQFFLSQDGGMGSNLEHSSADGTTAVKGSDFVFRCCIDKTLPEIPDNVDPEKLTGVEALKWNISPEVALDLEDAKVSVTKYINNFDLKAFSLGAFGKEAIKFFKMSPDAFIQQAIQLAYFRCHGKPAAVYESAATRRFKLGRTETIRSQSPYTLAFCKAMCDPKAPAHDKVLALKEAVNYHTWYTKEAINAQGVDRHLLGMKILASQAGMETPSIYTDVAYSRSLTHGLSTSQVPVDMDVFMCFGPTAETGYGVCYNPRKNKILLAVTSFNSCPETNSLSLGKYIIAGLNEMNELMATSSKL